MLVMNYKFECIKNMEYAESLKNCIQSGKTNALTLKKTMNEIDEVWMWVYQKYGMSRIIQKTALNQGETALTFLLPSVFYWIDKTMNGSDEIWRWVH